VVGWWWGGGVVEKDSVENVEGVLGTSLRKKITNKGGGGKSHVGLVQFGKEDSTNGQRPNTYITEW